MPDQTDPTAAVGRTPLVPLRRVVPTGHARVLVKVEGQNPTGSLKDRMALAVVDRALASGRLPRGGTLVEYTGGSTGTSLAFVCAARGVACTVVTSDAFSLEKRNHMRALGAEVIEIPSHGSGITRALIQGMMARAADLCTNPGTFAADQFRNPDATDGYASLAAEILEQSGGRVDAFVQAVGTGHSLLGTSRRLRATLPDVRVVAVEPGESPVLSGGAPGAHDIEGIGAGFVPPLWDPALIDEIRPVATEEAKAMARRLAREEGLFAGTSSGANVVAAIEAAGRLDPEATVVTLLCDTGLKYVTTSLYGNL